MTKNSLVRKEAWDTAPLWFIGIAYKDGSHSWDAAFDTDEYNHILFELEQDDTVQTVHVYTKEGAD